MAAAKAKSVDLTISMEDFRMIGRCEELGNPNVGGWNTQVDWIDPQTVRLSKAIPEADGGGYNRYIVTLPESLVLQAVPVD